MKNTNLNLEKLRSTLLDLETWQSSLLRVMIGLHWFMLFFVEQLRTQLITAIPSLFELDFVPWFNLWILSLAASALFFLLEIAYSIIMSKDVSSLFFRSTLYAQSILFMGFSWVNTLIYHGTLLELSIADDFDFFTLTSWLSTGAVVFIYINIGACLSEPFLEGDNPQKWLAYLVVLAFLIFNILCWL